MLGWVLDRGSPVSSIAQLVTVCCVAKDPCTGRTAVAGGDEQGHAGDTGQRRGAQGSAGNGVQPSWGCLPREVSSSRGTVSPASASPRAGWGFTKSIQSQCLATISGGQAGVLPSSQKGGYRPGCPRRHPAPCPRSILAARFKAHLGRRKLSQEEKGAVSFENVGCFSHLIW